MSEFDTAPSRQLDAGAFSSWLRHIRKSIVTESETAVPCGDCTACCRSSLFIHIKPEETETLASIPKEFQFPAPGFPKGYVVLGYDQNGKCPMLVKTKCSIYKRRPATCRIFDCRIFPATGIPAGEDDNNPIAQQAKRWAFSYPTRSDHDLHTAVRTAASFLYDRAELFPSGLIPQNKIQLAFLAIRVCDLFYDKIFNTKSRLQPNAAAKLVVETINRITG